MGLHKDVEEANLHESKGVSGASAGEIFVADGFGSGSFEPRVGQSLSIINQLSDFPAAVGGKITLEANKVYLMTALVITPDHFDVSAGNISMTALNAVPLLLNYAGTGDMFVGVDVSFSMFQIHVTCPLANLFAMTDTGNVHNVVLDQLAVDACLDFGTFDQFNSMSMLGIGAFNCTNGPKMTGAGWGGVSIERAAFISTSVTFVGINLQTCVSASARLARLALVGGAGSIGIQGDVASANITANNNGVIEDVNFNGVTTALVNISADDIRWVIEKNSIVPDTMPDALISMTANATSTTLTVGVPTLVAGTFTEERKSHFTTTAAGRITYIGERPLTTPMDIALTIDAGGANKSMRAYIAINGAAVVNSGKAVKISAGDPKELVIFWQAQLVQNDYMEIFIENEDDSVDATVVDATLRVR